MVDQVILSERSALQLKYKPAGFGCIHAALKSLVPEDAKRGLKTKIIYLDAVSDMAAVSGKDGPTDADKELKKYRGKLVECSGFIVGYSFLADKIKIVEDET